MYIGEQLGDLSDRKLAWAAQLGVEHVVVNKMKDNGVQQDDGTWRVEPIKATQKRFPDLWAGGPGRDKAIEIITQNIRTAGEAGIACLKYNCNIIGILRTGRTV